MKAGQPIHAHPLWRALLLETDALLGECRRETYQGSGAGGQKRNRVRSGIRLLHAATGLRAENCEHREAARNVAAALHGLRLQMALALGKAEPEKMDDGQNAEFSRLKAPAEAITRCRLEANPAHTDYAVTAALCLMALHHGRGGIAEAADALQNTVPGLRCSGSALTRALKADKAVWSAALRLRQDFGLSPLK